MFYGRKEVPNIYITPVIGGVKEKTIIFEGVKECTEEYHQPSGEHELIFVIGVIIYMNVKKSKSENEENPETDRLIGNNNNETKTNNSMGVV